MLAVVWSIFDCTCFELLSVLQAALLSGLVYNFYQRYFKAWHGMALNLPLATAHQIEAWCS